MKISFGRLGRFFIAALAVASLNGSVEPAMAKEPLAKTLFGGKKLPAAVDARTYGFYSKGCFSGGVAIATDGPTWQAMRLSRNRRWGHPTMIKVVERLSRDAVADGWPGLLIGDISQPRGGPMLSGHASHQVGLDADIWLTPMPNRTLSRSERENISAVSMLKKNSLYVDDSIWTQSRARLLKRAASYPEVERIFVHPGIKKKLCDTVQGDRSWLRKIRPQYGHDYHFHIRIGCQAGSSGCKGQDPAPRDDGCGQPLAWWFTEEPWRPAKPGTKPKPPARDLMTMASLPKACVTVLNAPNPASEEAVTYHGPKTRIVAAPAPFEEPPMEEGLVEPSAAAVAPDGIPIPKVDVPIPSDPPN
jgi:penicillin-insensitive murein endopeptidase